MLEPRLVLSQLTGLDLSVPQPADGQVATTTLLPLVGPSQSGQASSGQATPTWTQPRQLPGSKLRLLPPSDLYKIEPVIVAGDPSGDPPDSPANRVDPNTPDSLFAGVGRSEDPDRVEQLHLHGHGDQSDPRDHGRPLLGYECQWHDRSQCPPVSHSM